jgi:AcrR family transcriptional regulator
MSTPRNYSSPTREADAARTRARIVDAAALLFSRDGYAATPLRAIAVEAGVSVQSVHLAGPKSSLLLAAFERTFAGDEGDHSLTERPELIEIFSEPDAATAIDRYVAYIAAANERSAPIWRALSAASDADELVRAAAADLEQRRQRDMALGAGVLHARGLVAESNLVAVATELGFYTAAAPYLYFVEGCGWSRDAYAAWLRRALQSMVIAPY